MNDTEPQAPADAPAAAGNDSAPAPAREPDDLDSLLAEYNAAMKPAGNDAAPNGKAAEQAPTDGMMAVPKEQFDALLNQFASVRDRLGEYDAAQARALDRADWDSVLALARQQLPEGGRYLPGGETFADKYLTTRYVTDPAFKTALENRYASDEAKETARKAVERALKDMEREIKAMPDRELTEDRESVVASVLGRSLNKAPPSTPPNYGKMTPKEFADDVETKYGYRPKVG